jgi:hypothetical protein
MLRLIRGCFTAKFVELNKWSKKKVDQRPIISPVSHNFREVLARTSVIIASGPVSTHPRAYISVAADGESRFHYRSPVHGDTELAYRIPRDMANIKKIGKSTFPNFIHSLDALIIRHVVLRCREAGFSANIAHDATRS